MDKPKIKMLEDATFEECIDLEEYYNKRITKNIVREDVVLEQVSFDCCHFIGIDFTKFKIKKFELLDCIFDNCDLSNIEFSDLGIFRCIFKNCRMSGVIFSDCQLDNVELDSVLGNYMGFYKCEMKRLLIKNTNFNEGRFMENKMKDVVLQEVNFTKCDFIKTSFAGMDFSSSIIDSIKTDLYSLKSIKVNSEQALSLVQLLGIEVI